jgi:hypothetical protein
MRRLEVLFPGNSLNLISSESVCNAATNAFVFSRASCLPNRPDANTPFAPAGSSIRHRRDHRSIILKQKGKITTIGANVVIPGAP